MECFVILLCKLPDVRNESDSSWSVAEQGTGPGVGFCVCICVDEMRVLGSVSD